MVFRLVPTQRSSFRHRYIINKNYIADQDDADENLVDINSDDTVSSSVGSKTSSARSENQCPDLKLKVRWQILCFMVESSKVFIRQRVDISTKYQHLNKCRHLDIILLSQLDELFQDPTHATLGDL